MVGKYYVNDCKIILFTVNLRHLCCYNFQNIWHFILNYSEIEVPAKLLQYSAVENV
jgi:hypothetical protein